MKITIPNQITVGRLGLAIVFFALLSFYSAARAGSHWILPLAFWVFLAAAILDIADGTLARWMKQVTAFGRVVDPVVDKVMVLGAFGFFASQHFTVPLDGRVMNVTGVMPWMVVLLLIRELLVSAVRAQREANGVEAPAKLAGKVKMFVQSATVCVVLGQLAWFQAEGKLVWLRVGCVWLTLVVTVLSGVPYVRSAYVFLAASSAARGAAPAPAPLVTPGVAAVSVERAPEHSEAAGGPERPIVPPEPAAPNVRPGGVSA